VMTGDGGPTEAPAIGGARARRAALGAPRRGRLRGYPIREPPTPQRPPWTARTRSSISSG
jgi:hypothetical protein